MLVGFVTNQHWAIHRSRAALGLQVPDDLRVGVKDMLPLVIGNGDVEASLGVDRSHRRDTDRLRDHHVVLTIGRCHMHDAGAIVGRYKVAC
ncbi:Uncharacterised protein [Mycobacterium tuberculosis]|uniref:Uncharacterized protein n=1 Tax=Mycobacterium tuberculosis TaxID=1773 RepID=A0A0T7LIN5_MYCTX|nr:Uncharacterised protein [Mycobacterium tuberculosis]CFE55402.1 Uncharacterised protein [Mycobacterium tuberculosis]CFR67049.1 Uncharacterised protein [Mycobacterium tuberculosis]CKO13525.1 Uncharacterised protein [Mycobacterium tuberculosis]CKR62260.1 Uncharacterised protein [Mycobacterium tuberculosis]